MRRHSVTYTLIRHMCTSADKNDIDIARFTFNNVILSAHTYSFMLINVYKELGII